MTNNPFKVSVEKEVADYFVDKFESKVANTAFQGAKLYRVSEFTQNKQEYVVFELRAQFTEYTEIEGYTLAGLVQFENDQKFVTSFLDSIDWQKELPLIDSLRCDCCGHKRNRNKVFAVRNNENGKIEIVGGSCAKKFQNQDLEKMILGIRTVFTEVIEEITEKVSFYRDLSYELAICETLILNDGYVTRKQCEHDLERWSTASVLTSIVMGKGTLAESFSTDQVERINKRRFELINTELKEYKDLFGSRLEKKWTDFNHNCVAVLNGENASKPGYTAYMASQIVLPKKEIKKSFTGLNCPLNQMIDLGQFEIVNFNWKHDQYNDYAALTVVNSDNQKLWFKVAVTSQAYKKLFDCNDELKIKKVTLRGKVSAHKENISFAKNIKVI